MVSVVVFVVGLLLVGGLLFLGSAVLLGRGETQPPAELDRSPVELPDDRPVVGDDVRALQVSVAVRGYRMTEVDWLLDQLAQTIDERDVEIARLRAEVSAGLPAGSHAAEAADDVDAGRGAGERPRTVAEILSEETPGA
ncbi:MAG: cell division initiation protein DivIVA [Klenkia sp.]|nr:cell division initiation protein DivIVA [Klenkia sp.]